MRGGEASRAEIERTRKKRPREGSLAEETVCAKPCGGEIWKQTWRLVTEGPVLRHPLDHSKKCELHSRSNREPLKD